MTCFQIFRTVLVGWHNSGYRDSMKSSPNILKVEYMRINNMNTYLVALVAGLVFISGCAREKSSSEPSPGAAPAGDSITMPAPPLSPDGEIRQEVDLVRDSAWFDGATASLTMDSKAALEYYVALHPVNKPTDLAISVKLNDVGGKRYAGQIMVSYKDNGQFFTGKFKTENGTVPKLSYTPNKHVGKAMAEYNKWMTWYGYNSFHGFFEDPYGAVMIVIDGSLNLGDGQAQTSLSGEIWFKNFATSSTLFGTAPKSPSVPCWFIENGPYDCRTFLTNDGSATGNLVTTSALYPHGSQWFTLTKNNPYSVQEVARGWRRLGKFSGLDRAKAFGF